MTKLEPNGHIVTGPSRSPEPGIYAPIITLFTRDKKQDLDLDAQAAHAVRYPINSFPTDQTGWRAQE
jgi:hypothetical protein